MNQNKINLLIDIIMQRRKFDNLGFHLTNNFEINVPFNVNKKTQRLLKPFQEIWEYQTRHNMSDRG